MEHFAAARRPISNKLFEDQLDGEKRTDYREVMNGLGAAAKGRMTDWLHLSSLPSVCLFFPHHFFIQRFPNGLWHHCEGAKLFGNTTLNNEWIVFPLNRLVLFSI